MRMYKVRITNVMTNYVIKEVEHEEQLNAIQKAVDWLRERFNNVENRYQLEVYEVNTQLTKKIKIYDK